MNLRERLVNAREKAGLSQADLAKKLNVSAGTVAGWESEGEHAHGIHPDRLPAVAEALGISVSDLIAAGALGASVANLVA